MRRIETPISKMVYRLSSMILICSLLYVLAWDIGAINGSILMSRTVACAIYVAFPAFAVSSVFHARQAWLDYYEKRSGIYLLNALMTSFNSLVIWAMTLVSLVMPRLTGVFGSVPDMLAMTYLAASTFGLSLAYRGLRILYNLYQGYRTPSSEVREKMACYRYVLSDITHFLMLFGLLVSYSFPFGLAISSTIVLAGHLTWYVMPSKWKQRIYGFFGLWLGTQEDEITMLRTNQAQCLNQLGVPALDAPLCDKAPKQVCQAERNERPPVDNAISPFCEAVPPKGLSAA